MRRTLVLLAALVLAVLSAAPAGAIVYGEPDDGRHPSVGAMVVQADDDLFLFCSGSLIAPDIFLTASHCTASLTDFFGDDFQVLVSFDEVLSPSSTFYPGTPHTHPDFGFSGPGGVSDPHDVAVIVLDEPIAHLEPVDLPEEGLLDRLKADHQLRQQTFTAVGYGVVRETRKKAFQSLLPGGERNMALQSFYSLRPAWLVLSMNEATGDGGTCFGDSGGPHFLGGEESKLVVSITITGDLWCKATDETYRLDTASAREFLGNFLTLP